MHALKAGVVESQFTAIIRENEPLSSTELVRLANAERLPAQQGHG